MTDCSPLLRNAALLLLLCIWNSLFLRLCHWCILECHHQLLDHRHSGLLFRRAPRECLARSFYTTSGREAHDTPVSLLSEHRAARRYALCLLHGTIATSRCSSSINRNAYIITSCAREKLFLSCIGSVFQVYSLLGEQEGLSAWELSAGDDHFAPSCVGDGLTCQPALEAMSRNQIAGLRAAQIQESAGCKEEGTGLKAF
jgi:hypothetical protein